MGDLECGFEEMQGVRLGYLLIQGKQMFALSQVFTELLKNIPRTTVHKRMDHLNVKKHYCDLEELRKLKAINSIAFHAAKCTLISREDVEALYFSCKTERVLKSNKRKAKPVCDEEEDDDESTGFLHAEAELWKEKVWFSFHGVPETLTLHSKTSGRKKLTPGLTGSKLPQFYHKAHARDYRSMTKFGHRHFKNYETAKIPRDYLTLGHTQALVRRQPLLLQSAMTAQSRLARSDPLHKRKRRREGGGGRHALHHHHHHHHHVPPVLLVQPKTPGAPHPPGFGAFHFTPELYIDSRPHHHHPSLTESYSSDSESSTYSDRAYPDSDFGSGFSTSSASGTSDEEEDESDSTDGSSDEEDTSSHSDSSSVSSRVSVQSIRFRRARVGSLTKTQSKAPLVLQPTFHYNHQELPKPPSRIRPCDFGATVTDGPTFNYGAESIFAAAAAEEPNRSKSSCRIPNQPPGAQCDPDTDAKLPRGFDKREPISLNLPLKKIKIEPEDPTVNAPPYSDSGRTVNAPPFIQHNVKVKVEESWDEYHIPITSVQCKADKTEDSVTKQGEGVKATERSPGVPPASPGASQDWKNVQDSEKGNKHCKAFGRKSRKTKHNVQRVSKTAPQCEEGSAEELPSKRKRSSSVAAHGKMPFSLMAIFPSPPSLVVGSDGDLCPAYSLNSLRAPGTPPPSHPVWSWQPGGHILPPPFVHRTRKY